MFCEYIYKGTATDGSSVNPSREKTAVDFMMTRCVTRAVILCLTLTACLGLEPLLCPSEEERVSFMEMQLQSKKRCTDLTRTHCLTIDEAMQRCPCTCEYYRNAYLVSVDTHEGNKPIVGSDKIPARTSYHHVNTVL
ncbi:unnamed protein product [Soboliphyme baturini]|uniref:BTB domain-containing protein n=1 Tax=Soboliphyme baturini TaxID=241478 RepID=A0A183J943_9BILA|nr:unnamed protein product [Soboliphyme baturini]